MTDRLNGGSSARPLKLTAQQWCDRGNAILAGTEPTTKGEFLLPRHDVHWFVENGRATIGWKR
jgi:hypothetical protein